MDRQAIIADFSKKQFLTSFKDVFVMYATIAGENLYKNSKIGDKEIKFSPLIATSKILLLSKKNRTPEQLKLQTLIRPKRDIINVVIATVLEILDELITIKDSDGLGLAIINAGPEEPEKNRLKTKHTKNGVFRSEDYVSEVERLTMKRTLDGISELLDDMYQDESVAKAVINVISNFPGNYDMFQPAEECGALIKSIIQQKLSTFFKKTTGHEKIYSIVDHIVDRFLKIMAYQVVNYMWIDTRKESISVNMLFKILVLMQFNHDLINKIEKSALDLVPKKSPAQPTKKIETKEEEEPEYQNEFDRVEEDEPEEVEEEPEEVEDEQDEEQENEQEDDEEDEEKPEEAEENEDDEEEAEEEQEEEDE